MNCSSASVDIKNNNKKTLCIVLKAVFQVYNSMHSDLKIMVSLAETRRNLGAVGFFGIVQTTLCNGVVSGLKLKPA